MRIPRLAGAAVAAAVAAALPMPCAAAQTPVITQQGDPSVRPDSIYKLAVNPADFPEQTAAYLLDDGVVRLEADGRGVKTYRQIVQVLRPEGAEKLREQRFSYAPKHERFTINWIRVVKPDGTVIMDKPHQVQESDVPAQLGDPTYSDRRVIRVSLTGVEPGTLVDYSTTTEELKPFLSGDFFESWSISTGLAVKRSRYIVDVPESLAVHVIERNVRHPRTETRANGRRVMMWTAQDLQKIDEEAFAADSNDVYESVFISSPTTWARIGKWYGDNAAARYTLTASDLAKLHTVVAGAKTLDDSLRAVHKWVSQDIRYVAIALGMGGYQPRAPQEVIKTGFGDCKDKATLFVAALTRMGLSAWPVLLSADGGVRRDMPSIEQFDHVIAAFKRPGASGYEYADLTAYTTPLGELPFSEQDEFGLIVHRDGTVEEISFPKTRVADNRRTTRVVGTISTDGVFEGNYEEIGVGTQQYDLRDAFENPMESTTRHNAANAIAAKWFEGAEGSDLTGFDGKDLAAQAVLRLQLHHGKAGSLSGNMFVLKNPLGTMSSFALAAKELEAKPRRFPIDPMKIFGYRSASIEVRLTLPDGWKAVLPSNVRATSAFGTYESTFAQNGRELVLTRRLEGASGVQDRDKLSALTAWMRDVARDDASLIIIQKS